jgi:hypothetical protein
MAGTASGAVHARECWGWPGCREKKPMLLSPKGRLRWASQPAPVTPATTEFVEPACTPGALPTTVSDPARLLQPLSSSVAMVTPFISSRNCFITPSSRRQVICLHPKGYDCVAMRLSCGSEISVKHSEQRLGDGHILSRSENRREVIPPQRRGPQVPLVGSHLHAGLRLWSDHGRHFPP